PLISTPLLSLLFPAPPVFLPEQVCGACPLCQARDAPPSRRPLPLSPPSCRLRRHRTLRLSCRLRGSGLLWLLRPRPAPVPWPVAGLPGKDTGECSQAVSPAPSGLVVFVPAAPGVRAGRCVLSRLTPLAGIAPCQVWIDRVACLPFLS